MEPYKSYYYPSLYPPLGQGYRVEFFNQLHYLDTMIYEVTRPNDSIPYTFIVCQFMTHELFFHQLYGMEAFDQHADDRYFLARLWNDLFNTPYRPEMMSISIDEEDEPLVVRYPARSFIQRFMNQDRHTDAVEMLADTLFEEIAKREEHIGR